MGYYVNRRAKSKTDHHCDRQNFSFQLSCQKQSEARTLYVYYMDINNHCTPQKHQRDVVMIKHVTVAIHLKVRRTEFFSEIPSVAKIQSCFSTIEQPTYSNKIGENRATIKHIQCYGNTIFKMRREKWGSRQFRPSHKQIVLL